MKRILFLILLAPILAKAQAHLNASEQTIKEMHPDIVFTRGYTDKGIKYIYAEFTYGTFYYYFDSETGLTNACIQIPKNQGATNAQAEIYNNKYTVNSARSWTGYLDDGGIMSIKLEYDEDMKKFLFIYTAAK